MISFAFITFLSEPRQTCRSERLLTDPHGQLIITAVCVATIPHKSRHRAPASESITGTNCAEGNESCCRVPVQMQLRRAVIGWMRSAGRHIWADKTSHVEQLLRGDDLILHPQVSCERDGRRRPK